MSTDSDQPWEEEIEDSLSQSDGSDDAHADSDEEHSLLETVIRETMGTANQQSLELIFRVARSSRYADTSRIEAVEELVRAIVDQRFGKARLSNRLVGRIARSLVEAPEATVRIERLWQEARASG